MDKIKYSFIFMSLFVVIQIMCFTRCSTSISKKYTYEEQVSDTILKIRINDNLWVHWNQKQYIIQNDSLLDSVKIHFNEIREDLSYRILNLGPTNANVCGQRDLFIGDIILILIIHIGDIDNNHTIRTQFCVHDMGCPYPQGFFELVDKDRERIAERVLLYYQR